MSLLPARFQTSDDMPMSLGKAIARAIAPKVDPNAWFDAVARQYPDDKPPKAARTVEDVLSDPTDDEMQYIIKLRGGCRCSWPNAAPPCSICSTEYSEEEAAEALAECWQPVWPLVIKRVAAPPSTEPGVKFKPGDKVRYISELKHMAGIERVVSAVRENYFNGSKLVTRVEFTCGPHSWDRAEHLELIEPAPSPEVETVGDGWIEWKGGECPIPHAKPGEYELRFSDGDEVESTISVEWWELLWSKETAPETYWIVAYRVVKP